MDGTVEGICRSIGRGVGIILGLSSIGGPLYYTDELERKAFQHEIEEIQTRTEGRLQYVPYKNSFQGTVVPVTRDCGENLQKNRYDCLLYFQGMDISVYASPKTLGWLSRFDEAAATQSSCFLSATPTLSGLEFTSLSCQKTKK